MKLAADFRQNARNALRGKWGVAVIGFLVASLLGGGNITGGFTSISFDLNFDPSSLIGEESTSEITFDKIFSEPSAELLAVIGVALGIALMTGLVFGTAFFILGSIINVGYASFNLDIADGINGDLGTLFSYFRHWKISVLSNLLRHVYATLWSLLFFIPGIIVTYSYAMVPFIVAENPEISVRAALKRSKELMIGNRWQLFCLHVSFIGWWLLCILTLGLGTLWLRPYVETANADFYREISGTCPRRDSGDPAFDYAFKQL